jgi:hypothetical protein
MRVTGSFTTTSGNAITGSRPSKGEFTVTRKAAGVYVVTFNQSFASVVYGDADVGPATNVIGAGSVSLLTAKPGYAICSQDFMSSDGTHYSTDSNNAVLILVLAAANNALADVYSLGNTSSKANFRVGFEYILASSGLNS